MFVTYSLRHIGSLAGKQGYKHATKSDSSDPTGRVDGAGEDGAGVMLFACPQRARLAIQRLRWRPVIGHVTALTQAYCGTGMVTQAVRRHIGT